MIHQGRNQCSWCSIRCHRRVRFPPARRVVAPIPARVTHVLVQAGDVVTKGTAVIVLEAMKMEITLVAPRDGTIDVIRYIVGDMVEEGTELIHFADVTATLNPPATFLGSIDTLQVGGNQPRRIAMHWTDRRERYRAFIAGDECIHPASVYDAISARIAEDLGFEIGMFAGSIGSFSVLGHRI